MPLILIGLLAVLAHADDCTPINLKDEGRSMHGMPIEFQEDQSCAAYSAAQAGDAWIRSHDAKPAGYTPDFVISGTRLFDDLDRSGLVGPDGMKPATALAFLNNHPVCNARAMYGDSKKINPDMLPNLLKMVYDLAARSGNNPAAHRKFYESVQRRHPEWSAGLIGLQGSYEFNLDSGYAAMACNMIAKFGAMVPTGSAPALQIVGALLARETPDAFVAAFLDRACAATTVRPKLPPPVELSTRDDDKILSTLNARLDVANPQPVIIRYCPGVLSSKRPYDGRSNVVSNIFGHACSTVDRFFGKKSDESSSHASLVIGRRRNASTGSCEMLIRNTWSVKCEHYAKADSHWDCEDGGDAWVNARELAHNSFGLVYLDDK